MNKRINVKNQQKIKKVLLSLFVGIISISMLLPLVWMLSTSFKVEADVFRFPIDWIPRKWSMVSNYTTVFGGDYNFLTYYKNSILYSFFSVSLYIVLCSMAGYAFAKIKFKWSDQLFLIILATMMIPEQLILIPQFIIMRSFHIDNTISGLVLRSIFGSYGVFLLKQFMMSIPDSIIESGKIDGAKQWTIYSKLILPMSQASIATLIILKFVWTWNDYQGPLVFLRTASKYTLQIGLSSFVAGDGLSPLYSLLMAGSVVAIIPLLFVFIIFQKQVIGGIATGAVKG